MKYILLYWFKDKDGNFGDDLSPYLIHKLTGKKILYSPTKFFLTKVKIIWRLLRKREYLFKDALYTIFSNDKTILSIGSIIDKAKSSNIIWGSGLMHKDDFVPNAKFCAVRGKFTRERLINLGYDVPEIYGDPALLTPLVYNPTIAKKYKLGIIPHTFQYDETKKFLEKININNVY